VRPLALPADAKSCLAVILRLEPMVAHPVRRSCRSGSAKGGPLERSSTRLLNQQEVVEVAPNVRPADQTAQFRILMAQAVVVFAGSLRYATRASVTRDE